MANEAEKKLSIPPYWLGIWGGFVLSAFCLPLAVLDISSSRGPSFRLLQLILCAAVLCSAASLTAENWRAYRWLHPFKTIRNAHSS